MGIFHVFFFIFVGEFRFRFNRSANISQFFAHLVLPNQWMRYWNLSNKYMTAPCKCNSSNQHRFVDHYRLNWKSNLTEKMKEILKNTLTIQTRETDEIPSYKYKITFSYKSSYVYCTHARHSTQFIADRLVFEPAYLPIILADIHNTTIFVIKIVISIFRILCLLAFFFSFLFEFEFSSSFSLFILVLLLQSTVTYWIVISAHAILVKADK